MKINILDSSVFNLISAGEVIERPASVVKELVENSIDAMAKSIRIEIAEGGKQKIKITDDGTGISKDSIETAFLPHATSKLAVASDLQNIKTLGFRGEALASIASVSKIEIQTCTEADDGCATIVELVASRLDQKKEIGGNRGTSICVNNLFFNTPARYKFLKSTKGEENEITALVQKFILSNPSVAFTYIIDGKTVYQTRGGELIDAISAVYNRETILNFNLIENTFNGFSMKGYFSSPTFFKGNRNYQTIIVNGRIVENKTIQTAVEKAYEGFLMKRSFPLYVLELNVFSEFLDVNVHPCKTEVRFQDNNKLFGFIYHTVRKFLENYHNVKEISKLLENENIDRQYNNEYANSNVEEIACDSSEVVEKTSNSIQQFAFDDNIPLSKPTYSSKFSGLRSDSGIAYRAIKAAENLNNFNENAKNNQLNRDNNIDKDFDFSKKFDNLSVFEDKFVNNEFYGRIIGQLFSTYILLENEDNLFIIDQHAAHERIIYDKLINNVDTKFSQTLLIPYIFEASFSEYEFAELCVKQLNKIGFDIEPFGNLSFKVSAVPAVLIDINLDKFFTEALSDLSRSQGLKNIDLLKDKLAQTACKNAVKAGDTLNESQIKVLISSFNSAKDKPLLCPHGRPCVIKITKTELEKWFKRIV